MEEIHKTYSKAYRLVSMLLLPPSTSRPLLESHKDDVITFLARLGSNIENWHPRITEALNHVRTLAGEVLECLSSDECWEKFAEDYSSITVTGYKHVKCPPFESVYVIKGGYKMIEIPAVADSLERYYKLLGLEPDKEKAFGSDHISIEIEYLAALHDAEALALSGELPNVNPANVSELRSAFLEDHLMKWAPMFMDCVKKNTRNKIVNNNIRSLEELLFTERYL